MSDSPAPAPTQAPPVTFYTFVVSLGQAAMAPLSQDIPTEEGLMIAQSTIQTLALLQDKTKGNLDDEEGKLLEAILSELRGKLPSANA